MGSPAMGIDVGPPDAGSRFIGIQSEIAPANPAAGADWSYRVPGGTWQRIQAARATLTASAAVANRNPRLEVQDPDGLRLWAWTAGINQTAVQVVDWLYSPSGLAADRFAQSIYQGGLPSFWLPAGYIVRMVTAGLDVADQWANVRLIVEELDRGPLGETVGTDTLSSF